jgi:hypothetical protein
MEQLGSHWKDFNEICYLSIFRKSDETFQVLLKSDKNNGYFTQRHSTFMIISHGFLLRMRNISDKFVENIKTHILCSITFFFSKVVPFMR